MTPRKLTTYAGHACNADPAHDRRMEIRTVDPVTGVVKISECRLGLTYEVTDEDLKDPEKRAVAEEILGAAFVESLVDEEE